MENIKILRHTEEKNQSDRDGDLLESELYIIKDNYAPNIVLTANTRELNDVNIICSDTKRSIRTAEVLSNCIHGFDPNLNVCIEQDPRIVSLTHGKYKDNVLSSHPLYNYAQKVYLEETYINDNPWYKHGDPCLRLDGSYKYPELLEIFDEPGESQSDVSIRLYDAILNLISREEELNSKLFVLSTHYVVLSRLMSLQYIADTKDIDKLPSVYADGKLYQWEWEANNEILNGEDFRKFYKNFIYDLDMNKILKLKEAIKYDLSFLLGNKTIKEEAENE